MPLYDYRCTACRRTLRDVARIAGMRRRRPVRTAGPHGRSGNSACSPSSTAPSARARLRDAGCCGPGRLRVPHVIELRSAGVTREDAHDQGGPGGGDRPADRRLAGITRRSSWTGCSTRSVGRSARASISRSAASARSRCASAAPGARAIRAAGRRCWCRRSWCRCSSPARSSRPWCWSRPKRGQQPVAAAETAVTRGVRNGFWKEAEAQEDRDAQAQEASAEESS